MDGLVDRPHSFAMIGGGLCYTSVTVMMYDVRVSSSGVSQWLSV